MTLPFLTMVAVAAAVMGTLNSLHHYFVPALSPAMFNVATIVGTFALVRLIPRLGWPPIMATALAALAGGVGQIAIQWPAFPARGSCTGPCSRREDRLADLLCDRREPSPRHVSGAVLVVNTSQERRAGARDGISGAGARHVHLGDRNAAALVWLLQRRLDGLEGRRLLLTLLKVSARPRLCRSRRS
jgi:lipid II flippase MurJ-like protein